MSEASAAIIRSVYDNLAQGNIPAALAVFDKEITWHVPGRGPLSGDYKGPEEIGRLFQRTIELCGGNFSIELHNVLVDGDLVVVLLTGNAQRKGVSASFSEVHVWRLREGKVIAFREYQGDEQREDQFWA